MVEESSAQGLAALGVDVKGIIFQTINFLILLLVLKWLAYKPILAVLDKRNKMISDGLKTAQDLEEKKRAWEEKENQLTRKTLARSQKIIQEAQSQAEELHQKTLEKTQKQQNLILQKTKDQLTQEKQKIITEAKSEISGLALLAAQKILKGKIDSITDQKIIQHSLKK